MSGQPHTDPFVDRSEELSLTVIFIFFTKFGQAFFRKPYRLCKKRKRNDIDRKYSKIKPHAASIYRRLEDIIQKRLRTSPHTKFEAVHVISHIKDKINKGANNLRQLETRWQETDWIYEGNEQADRLAKEAGDLPTIPYIFYEGRAQWTPATKNHRPVERPIVAIIKKKLIQILGTITQKEKKSKHIPQSSRSLLQGQKY